jgi:hypothetical protein
MEEVKRDPASGHLVSLGGDVAGALAEADLLISDVSSLAIDFLVTGRPLTVTIPPSRQAVVVSTPLLELAPRLGELEVSRVGAFVAGLIEDDLGQADRLALAEYYLGDTRPGAATRAFVGACSQMIELAEANLAEFGAAAGAAPGAMADQPDAGDGV